MAWQIARHDWQDTELPSHSKRPYLFLKLLYWILFTDKPYCFLTHWFLLVSHGAALLILLQKWPRQYNFCNCSLFLHILSSAPNKKKIPGFPVSKAGQPNLGNLLRLNACLSGFNFRHLPSPSPICLIQSLALIFLIQCFVKAADNQNTGKYSAAASYHLKYYWTLTIENQQVCLVLHMITVIINFLFLAELSIVPWATRLFILPQVPQAHCEGKPTNI